MKEKTEMMADKMWFHSCTELFKNYLIYFPWLMGKFVILTIYHINWSVYIFICFRDWSCPFNTLERYRYFQAIFNLGNHWGYQQCTRFWRITRWSGKICNYLFLWFDFFIMCKGYFNMSKLYTNAAELTMKNIALEYLCWIINYGRKYASTQTFHVF